MTSSAQNEYDDESLGDRPYQYKHYVLKMIKLDDISDANEAQSEAKVRPAAGVWDSKNNCG